MSTLSFGQNLALAIHGRINLIKFHNGMASSAAACFIIRNRSEGSAYGGNKQKKTASAMLRRF